MNIAYVDSILNKEVTLNRELILTLIHWLGPPLFTVVIHTDASNLESGAC